LYDIFYIKKSNEDESKLAQFRERFPFIKFLDQCDNFFETIQNAQKKSMTKFFWIFDYDVRLNDDFDFDYSVEEWDSELIHIFKHRVYLVPKKYQFSKEEIKFNFIKNQKKIDITVSDYPYDIFIIDTFAEYNVALEESETSMFWVLPNNIEVYDNFEFDLYFYPNNKYDNKENHAFLNKINNTTMYNGVFLCSKDKKITEKEIKTQNLKKFKEHKILASRVKPYDMVFISYNEPNADKNYKELTSRFPQAKRVHGVKGIHNAHIEAAKLCTTPMFWVVDGDANIVEDFDFTYRFAKSEEDGVYVWRSKNPINSLVYGYGGVKLLPRSLTIKMDVNSLDMTTSISKKFVAMDEVSNITAFNTDPFSTWKSAFRECSKLASRSISGQIDSDTQKRLDVWCTKGLKKLFGKYAIDGAIKGRNFGLANKNDREMLKKINDWNWLENEFNKQ
jgi:hypothetical protein